MVLSSFNNGNNTCQSWEMIPSHIKSLRWSFHLPSDPHSLLWHWRSGAFYQQLTGAIPLTPVLGLIGACVRARFRQRWRDALEANSVICFLHLPSLPTNSSHLCQPPPPPPPLMFVPPSQQRDKENNKIRRERDREWDRKREGFSIPSGKNFRPNFHFSHVGSAAPASTCDVSRCVIGVKCRH